MTGAKTVCKPSVECHVGGVLG